MNTNYTIKNVYTNNNFVYTSVFYLFVCVLEYNSVLSKIETFFNVLRGYIVDFVSFDWILEYLHIYFVP